MIKLFEAFWNEKVPHEKVYLFSKAKISHKFVRRAKFITFEKVRPLVSNTQLIFNFLHSICNFLHCL